MKKINRLVILFVLTVLFQNGLSQENSNEKIFFPLNSLENIEMVNVEGAVVEHQGKYALRVTAHDDSESTEELETIVLIPEIKFTNGIIELEVAGEPAPGAFAQARGFVGIAFRVNKLENYKYECFYLRPTNGRANIQAQRNHSIQYVSHPEYPWYRLRQESPEMYESYADLIPGNWTKLKIEVFGTTAKFYLQDAEQPNLIVNDLKHGESEGTIALWLHSSTLAHFRNLVIHPDQ